MFEHGRLLSSINIQIYRVCLPRVNLKQITLNVSETYVRTSIYSRHLSETNLYSFRVDAHDSGNKSEKKLVFLQDLVVRRILFKVHLDLLLLIYTHKWLGMLLLATVAQDISGGLSFFFYFCFQLGRSHLGRILLYVTPEDDTFTCVFPLFYSFSWLSSLSIRLISPLAVKPDHPSLSILLLIIFSQRGRIPAGRERKAIASPKGRWITDRLFLGFFPHLIRSRDENEFDSPAAVGLLVKGAVVMATTESSNGQTQPAHADLIN